MLQELASNKENSAIGSFARAPIFSSKINLNFAEIFDALSQEEWVGSVAFDPIKQVYYEPRSAMGSKSVSIGRELAYLHLWAVFDDLIVPHIMKHDARDLIVGDKLSVSLLKKGNYLIEHDDLGDLVMPDGSVRQVAYSSLFYLNDVQGGELVLSESATTIEAKEGNVVVFPAEARHKVLAVQSEERYAVLFRLYVKKEIES